MLQRLRCTFRPLLPHPFLPGSWLCLSINKAASFQTLPFPGQVSCQMLFLSRFEIDRWHLSSFAGSLKGSAAAFGRCCHSHFCQVPGHAWRLSCQLPDFAFSWPRLLPNGVSIAPRSCWMALFLRFRKPLYASKALLQL